MTESCRCLCTADEDVSQSQINRIYFRYNYQECLNIIIYRYYSELNNDEATECGWILHSTSQLSPHWRDTRSMVTSALASHPSCRCSRRIPADFSAFLWRMEQFYTRIMWWSGEESLDSSSKNESPIPVVAGGSLAILIMYVCAGGSCCRRCLAACGGVFTW